MGSRRGGDALSDTIDDDAPIILKAKRKAKRGSYYISFVVFGIVSTTVLWKVVSSLMPSGAQKIFSKVVSLK